MSSSNFSGKKCNIFFLLFLCNNLDVIILIIAEGGWSMTDTQIVKELVGLEPNLNVFNIEEVKLKGKKVEIAALVLTSGLCRRFHVLIC